jgi:hypothetical protein
MKRILVAALLTGSIVSTAYAGETRREAVAAADADNNHRLDGKEMKSLKTNHPKMYDNLVGFCEDAAEHPKKNGVDLPENAEKDQTQCKKKHVAKPFIVAWLAQVEAEEASAPVDVHPPMGDGSPSERSGESPSERNE